MRMPKYLVISESICGVDTAIFYTKKEALAEAQEAAKTIVADFKANEQVTAGRLRQLLSTKLKVVKLSGELIDSKTENIIEIELQLRSEEKEFGIITW